MGEEGKLKEVEVAVRFVEGEGEMRANQEVEEVVLAQVVLVVLGLQKE
jgi:hypothetical protein